LAIRPFPFTKVNKKRSFKASKSKEAEPELFTTRDEIFTARKKSAKMP
jgi:hypothetical protein